MRVCAKMHCGARPAATIALVYSERQIVISDLSLEHDPNFLDLCRDHVARMTPPRGWAIQDLRPAVDTPV